MRSIACLALALGLATCREPTVEVPMTKPESLAAELEELRQQLPDPFHYDDGLPAFFQGEKARALVAGGAASAQRLLQYLDSSKDPSLARVAVLMLSRMDPTLYYPELLAILGRKEAPMVEAFDLGFWRIPLPEQKLARDVVDVVAKSGQASPLLLLQRPVAAAAVHPELERLIDERRQPFARYAMFALGYALVPEDIPFLIRQAQRTDDAEIASLAGIYLLRLGSRAGVNGIEAGLTSPDADLRTSTYYELSRHLPKDALERIRFDPAAPPASQRAAVTALLGLLGRQ
jgi:HEAT repeat protein